MKITRIEAFQVRWAASDKPARHHRIKKLAIGKHRRAKIAGVPATDYVTQGREWPLRQF